jgi:hypothetical protein
LHSMVELRSTKMGGGGLPKVLATQNRDNLPWKTWAGNFNLRYEELIPWSLCHHLASGQVHSMVRLQSTKI